MAYNLTVSYVPPADIHHVWPDIKHMVKEAAEYDCENVWVEDIYAAIRSGTYALHTGRDFHGTVIAMCISQIQRDQWDNEPRFVALYTHAENCFLDHEHELENIAKELGCAKICYRSPRVGYLRLAKQRGYDLAYMQFEKRL